MFEKAKPPAIPSAHPNPLRESTRAEPNPDAHGGEWVSESSDALRPIEWVELSARLAAARDFRDLLRSDRNQGKGLENPSFAEAAAHYFRAREEDQRCVNHKALEPRKTSSGIPTETKHSSEFGKTSAKPVATLQREPGDAREQ